MNPNEGPDVVLSKRYLSMSSTKEGSYFTKAREEEICGLIKNGTFHVVNISSIGKDIRIVSLKFVDTLKPIDDVYRYKIRLVTHYYGDKHPVTIATKTQTVQRSTQRLIFSLAASMDETSPHIRYITQAYIQSTTLLERLVYIRPPKKMSLPADMILKVVKTLYGITESGLHCYLTYLEYHLSAFNMIQSRVSSCFLIQGENKPLSAMAILQVDDGFIIRRKSFPRKEDKMSIAFLSKPRKAIWKRKTLSNGIELSVTSEKKITMAEPKKLMDL